MTFCPHIFLHIPNSLCPLFCLARCDISTGLKLFLYVEAWWHLTPKKEKRTKRNINVCLYMRHKHSIVCICKQNNYQASKAVNGPLDHTKAKHHWLRYSQNPKSVWLARADLSLDKGSLLSWWSKSKMSILLPPTTQLKPFDGLLLCGQVVGVVGWQVLWWDWRVTEAYNTVCQLF